MSSSSVTPARAELVHAAKADLVTNAEWSARDLDVVWHPCTQMQDHEALPMIPIQRGDGVWLYDFDGNRYLDAVSSWWVNLFGHANPDINAALTEQMAELEHVIMAGMTHPAAIRLAERLVALTPPGLKRVFFADNGSAAVEVALKMSFHYWLNSGEPQRKHFVNLSNSYHGETLGALAVGDVGLYKDTYGPLLLEPITVPSPDCYTREQGVSWKTHSERMFEPMEQLLKQRHDEICAVIIEPLVQCAGQMRMYHPVYLSLLREACDRYGVHFIADEIAVGFGRTGTLFACEQANVSPDFLCLSKGLSGGYLPISAVLTSEKIYRAFYDRYETLRGFLHSHSYTGNALACRAALATLDIFESQPVLSDNRDKAALMGRLLAELEDHPHVGEVRQTGMIAAVELVRDRKTGEPFDWKERRGLRVYQYGLGNEMLLRPLGNVVYFMPPYVITEDQIEHMVAVAKKGIDLAVQ